MHASRHGPDAWEVKIPAWAVGHASPLSSLYHLACAMYGYRRTHALVKSDALVANLDRRCVGEENRECASDASYEGRGTNTDEYDAVSGPLKLFDTKLITKILHRCVL